MYILSLYLFYNPDGMKKTQMIQFINNYKKKKKNYTHWYLGKIFKKKKKKMERLKALVLLENNQLDKRKKQQDQLRWNVSRASQIYLDELVGETSVFIYFIYLLLLG